MSAGIVLGDGPLDDDATVDRDVMVRMRDGVKIACDVFRPIAPGKYPVLFATAPYLKDTVDLPSTGVYRYRALDPERTTKLAPYHTHTEIEPLEPIRIYPFAIEIWPTCWIFKAGHRIRLELTAFDNNSFLGHLRGTDSFYHDAERPSHLALPMIA